MREINLDFQDIVHFNNFVFLVFSYCTLQITDNNVCQQDSQSSYLSFVYYGNVSIYIIFLMFLMLMKCKILDRISQNCGAVVLTINTFIVLGGIIIFDFLCMVIAIYQYFFQEPSQCKELQLFTMVCAYIFFIWLGFLVCSIISRFFIKKPSVAVHQDNYYIY